MKFISRHRSLVVLTFLLACFFVQTAVAIACTPLQIKRSTVQMRAGYGVGYSYWWGGARWDTGVNTSDGSCCGSCGSCSHWASKNRNSRCGSDEAGVVERGADCSGYVSTAWYANPSCTTFWITAGQHNYSTWDFKYGSQFWWTFTNLSSLKNMDAVVRYDSDVHHIVLFNLRDLYGSPVVYEAKGCSYGIVYGKRTFDSRWIGVRRDNIVDG